MMTQGEAVYQAVCTVLENNSINEKIELNPTEKKAVYAHVHSYFESSQVAYSGTAPLSKYVPGLVNNWLRKDTRLNGGGKYSAKNPGIRAGSGDAALKAMKALLSAQTDASARAQIQAAIDQRIAELKPKKVVDLAALPPELRHLVVG